MVTHYMLRKLEGKLVFLDKNIQFVTDIKLIKSFIQVKNRNCILRLHLFMSYHLINIPCYVCSFKNDNMQPHN